MLIPVCAPAAGGNGPGHTLDVPGVVPFLAYGPSSGLGRIVQHVLGQRATQDTRLRETFLWHQATLLRAMALQGRGIAWLPGMLVQADLAAGRLLRAGKEEWDIPADICLYRQPSAMAPAAEQLWELVQPSPAQV